MFAFDLTVSLGLLLSIVSIIFAWFRTRRKAVDDRFDKLMDGVDRRFHDGSKRMDELASRLQATEQTVASMPGKDDMHRVEMMLVEMGGDMKAVRAFQKSTADSVNRIEGIVGRHEDYLRENG